MRVYLLVLLLLGGCATAPKPQPSKPRASWLPAADQWNIAKSRGATFKRPDGSLHSMTQVVAYNLVTAKERIEVVSGVKAELAIIDTDQPNAYATTLKDGRQVIAFTTAYLNYLGNDKDALATTVGHELAHLHLNHSGDARKTREEWRQAGSQILGVVLGVAGIPFGGSIANAGVTAFTRSFTRDEERDADTQGLQWAVAAGFDPCGKARSVAVFQRMSSGGQIPLLSTHPGYAERSELANEYSLKANNRPCSESSAPVQTAARNVQEWTGGRASQPSPAVDARPAWVPDSVKSCADALSGAAIRVACASEDGCQGQALGIVKFCDQAYSGPCVSARQQLPSYCAGKSESNFCAAAIEMVRAHCAGG
jgi:hypothetical protein